MKLLVVGGPAKGKTTLIEYLIKGKTLRTPIATLGVNIREWRCVLSSPTLNVAYTRSSNMQLWSETRWKVSPELLGLCWSGRVLHNTSMLPYHTITIYGMSTVNNAPSLIMWVWQVVYDLSKGEEELATISPWLLNIQARAPSSPIVVVGTHRDLIGN